MNKETIKNLIIQAKQTEDNVTITFSRYADDEPLSEWDTIGILTASLSMALKTVITDMDYKTQGKLLKDVIEKLEDSFMSGESFKDLKKMND